MFHGGHKHKMLAIEWGIPSARCRLTLSGVERGANGFGEDRLAERFLNEVKTMLGGFIRIERAFRVSGHENDLDTGQPIAHLSSKISAIQLPGQYDIAEQ